MDKESRKAFVDSVEGINKERDYIILEFHALYPDLTWAESVKALSIEISEGRYSQILNANRDLILKLFARINPLYFKEGRAIELVKMYRRKTKGGVASGKDSADIMEALRKEVEGDKTSIGVFITNKEKDGEPSLTTSDLAFQERIRADLAKSRLR